MRSHPAGCLCVRCVDDDAVLGIDDYDIEQDDGEFDDDEMGIDPEEE